ncbi:protein of unknown function [Sediminibacterium ginsengisoli]|uniref:Uncharacterized protein n=2 Tax=Sediminibacterium ginsengisoli TaxID=413434 RepID=A0A1T4QTY7_9BACT|nr:protein of unknown function [Sediminibacterium ginsengisoli]
MANNAEIARRFIAPYKGALKQHDKLEEFKMKLEISSGIEERRALVAILNYFECISLLLEDDLIDEAILKKCFKTTFRTYYINLKEFIEDWQRGNDGANHRIFINFVALAKKME